MLELMEVQSMRRDPSATQGMLSLSKHLPARAPTLRPFNKAQGWQAQDAIRLVRTVEEISA